MFSVHKPLYYIVTGKYIFEGVPYLGIEDFTGTSNCGKFFDFSD